MQHPTKIPIPAPLDWSDDPSNPIGSAYIILEHTGKIALQKVWNELLSDKKVKTIDAIYTGIAPISNGSLISRTRHFSTSIQSRSLRMILHFVLDHTAKELFGITEIFISKNQTEGHVR